MSRSSHFLLPLHVVLIFALGFLKEARSEEFPQGCDSNQISELLNAKPVNGVRAEKLTMTFAPRNFTFSNGEVQGTAVVAVPTISLESDMEGFISALKARMEGQATQAAHDAGLDLESFSIDSMRPAGATLQLGGHISVEKKWKTKWTCCKWLKCRTCWKEVRLFERTVDFSANINRQFTPIPTNFFVGTASLVQPPIVSARADGRRGMDFTGRGETNNDRRFLEKVWDFFGKFLRWIDHDLLGGENTWTFKDWLKQSVNYDQDGPDPYLFQRQLYAFGVPQEDSSTGIDQRWFWQSFVGALQLDERASVFTVDQGRQKYTTSFTLDYDRYAALSNIFGLGKSSGGAVFGDPLESNTFCLPKSRETLVGYLKAVKDGFEGKQPGPKTISAEPSQFRRQLFNYYGVWGAEEYLRARRLRRESKIDGKRVFTADAPDVQSILGKPGLVPILGNLWNLSNEQFWKPEEQACIKRAAVRRSGRASKIFPLQSFEDCLSENNDQLTGIQLQVAEAAIHRNDSEGELKESGSFSDPIAGGSELRGWYYCKDNPTLCIGEKRVMWTQKPSGFKSRNGRQTGVDLHDFAGTSETLNLLAVASGRLTFSNSDSSNWKNALLLPFKKDGVTYLAVYTGLPDNTKEQDGKSVSAADQIGSIGCGLRSERCNTSCLVNGAYRSEIHIHFEMIQVGDVYQKVDPKTVLPNFQPHHGTDEHIYDCAEDNRAFRKAGIGPR
jgi:hypothetical protein